MKYDSFIYDMEREELEALIFHYDQYIQEANDEDKYNSGWRPVCIDEFIDCEWKVIKEQYYKNGEF